jgi:PmbA protein
VKVVLITLLRLGDMPLGIQAVGSDTYNYGAKTIGSVLINRMKVAGS